MIENKFMDHLEAIVKIDQIIGDDFCDDISNHIDKINLSNMGMISGVDKKGRNVLGYTLQKKDKILFKKPSVFSKPLAKIKKGRLLIIQKCEDEWCNVKTENFKGWVNKNYLWGFIN